MPYDDLDDYEEVEADDFEANCGPTGLTHPSIKDEDRPVLQRLDLVMIEDAECNPMCFVMNQREHAVTTLLNLGMQKLEEMKKAKRLLEDG